MTSPAFINYTSLKPLPFFKLKFAKSLNIKKKQKNWQKKFKFKKKRFSASEKWYRSLKQEIKYWATKLHLYIFLSHSSTIKLNKKRQISVFVLTRHLSHIFRLCFIYQNHSLLCFVQQWVMSLFFKAYDAYI